MGPTAPTATSSPKKRARRTQQLLLRRRWQPRDLLRPLLGRIFARRLPHLPPASHSHPQPRATASAATYDIRDAIRGAARSAARRWNMAAEPSGSGLRHAETLAFFAQRRSALLAISESAVTLALAPVFYCCVALDRVATQPVALPTTSVFSASVITFVLKLFTAATELRHKHLTSLLASGSSSSSSM